MQLFGGSGSTAASDQAYSRSARLPLIGSIRLFAASVVVHSEYAVVRDFVETQRWAIVLFSPFVTASVGANGVHRGGENRE
jgi:hypothetical protein